jgi:hypothetical protein
MKAGERVTNNRYGTLTLFSARLEPYDILTTQNFRLPLVGTYIGAYDFDVVLACSVEREGYWVNFCSWAFPQPLGLQCFEFV